MIKYLKDAHTPWTDVMYEEEHVIVYKDKYPVTPMHLLYVPKTDSSEDIAHAMHMAYTDGLEMVASKGDITGFNVGMNNGIDAGQTIIWPHVHLIFRTTGDSENPIGGVRKCVDGNGNYLDDIDAPTVH